VSSIRYAKSFLKRIARRLLVIAGDENPRDKRQNTTEEYRRINKRKSRQQ
jgi:hypothetical protein